MQLIELLNTCFVVACSTKDLVIEMLNTRVSPVHVYMHVSRMCIIR